MLGNFCEVCLNLTLHIFQVAGCDPVWVQQLVIGIVHWQSKHGCVGICRSEVYLLMKLISAWLKVAFPQCEIASTLDPPLIVHEVNVFELWMHLCNPLYTWRLPLYSIVNP